MTFCSIFGWISNNLLGLGGVGAALWGCWIAQQGLNTWRNEHIGKKQAELAEDILFQFYTVKNIFNNIGKHTVSNDDIATYFQMDKAYDCYDLLAYYSVSKQHNEFTKLFAFSDKAEIFWGKDIVEVINKIEKIVDTITLLGREKMLSDNFDKTAPMGLAGYGRVMENQLDVDTKKSIDDIVAEVKLNLEPYLRVRAHKWKKLNG